MRDLPVQLIRRFVPDTSGLGNGMFLRTVATRKPLGWHELEDSRRVLILADPGAGKTFEALDRARKIHARGAKAFFIRIEAIGASFDQAFEVGTSAEFSAWLTSNEEAWFFLDSVDEAQLETPRALEDAIRIFGGRIHDARERARIFITSRQDAWQALSDHTLIEQFLPYGAPDDQPTNDAEYGAPMTSTTLKVYWLTGLKTDEIKLFASYYDIGDVDAFMAAIERGSLMQLAERPFDLKSLIRKWQADQMLGSRLVVLRRMIELQLAQLPTTVPTLKIDAVKMRAGARMLAAAVTLTGKSIICLPDGLLSAHRISPMLLLPDWTVDELGALLRTGIFDDIVYSSVRFRHREIRELLTAEWALDLLGRPGKRLDVESLFFRTQYGEHVIVPRLRPTLTWLLLLDDGMRDKALAIEPEIASEGGDPSQLPLPVRKTMLTDIVERIVAEKG